MNARTRRFALLLLGLAAVTVASTALTAQADPPKTKLLFAPGEPYGLPKFGFSSSTISGFGERVEFVRPGGRAYNLGLEPGDVILSLNGYKLTYHGSWNDALSRALYNNNYLRLKIRDYRTGNVYFRDTYISYDTPTNYFKQNGGSPKNAGFPNGHDNHDDNDHHNNFGKPLKTASDMQKLFN